MAKTTEDKLTPEERERLARVRARRDAAELEERRILSKGRKRERSDDLQKKIEAGAIALAEAERRPEFKAELFKLLARHVVRPDRRKLFGLPPLPDQAVDAAQARRSEASTENAPELPAGVVQEFNTRTAARH